MSLENQNPTETNKNMPTELHLMILWEFACNKEGEIINDLKKNHRILGIHNISWSKEHFSHNLSRFYGENLPSNSNKEKHCGKGAFKLITFLDEAPNYNYVNTGRGSEYVNHNVFSLKEKYRQWTGGGHKVHTTNTPEETRHDLLLLLGEDYHTYKLNNSKLCSTPQVEFSSRDLIGGGEKGWHSLKELLSVMNRSLNYLVLRNFETLPDNYHSDIHGDIDFLVEDLQEAVNFIGAKKIHKKDYRVYYSVRINHEDVFIDLRHIGDNYYDLTWQKAMLKDRILSVNGFYTPEKECYFYSLIYHVLIHKKRIAPDYPEKLSAAAKEASFNKDLSFDNYYSSLLTYMGEHNYKIICPKDKSVYFDLPYLPNSALKAELDKLRIHSIEPFLTELWKNGSGCTYFQGISYDNKKAFIKVGGTASTTKREFFFLTKLLHISGIPAPEPFYYRHHKGVNFIVTEISSSTRTLNQVNPLLLDKVQRLELLKQLVSIISSLHASNYIHRDIRPANFMVSNDLKLTLIDFQYAIDQPRKEFSELKDARATPLLIRNLGDLYAKGQYRWDDAFSALLIFDEYCGEMSHELITLRKKLEKIIGAKEAFGIKSSTPQRLKWYYNAFLKIFKTHIKITFYKLTYKLVRKEKYLKKIKKNNLNLSRIWNSNKQR